MISKEDLRIKWLIYFYGGNILEAMMLDDLLENINNSGMIQFNFNRIPSKNEKDLTQNLDYLVQQDFLKSYDNNYFDITQKGKLHLAGGGFAIEAKKNKNSLFAFRISIVSITIAVLSALATFFGWFRTSM